MAALASRTFASASTPPSSIAAVTQCARCSSRRDSAKDSKALVVADTWVSTSMQ